ncbi:pentapeptide repeat-containing protein [Pontibacter chitinilyticus]|uniref:pentapeptide repeat-containing protein n=1 Tax=Pontibacter chitinilyticus TaxID=2674989 RepID=UPI0032199CB0
MEGTVYEGKTFDKILYPGKAIKNREFETCTFKNCDFSNADFSVNRFTDCVFIGCNLALLKLNRSTLSHVVFRECKLTGINFSECGEALFTVRFESCFLDYASFVNRKMPKTLFSSTSLKGTDFTNATLTSAVFDNTNLEGAVFSGTQLSKANFLTAYNYTIDPEMNYLQKARFSRHGIAGLLTKYNLEIE